MIKPSTTFKWVDNSGQSTSVEVPEVRPLFLQVASFDRGPEDLRVVYGDTFYKLYGTNISYKKHGQPAIQAANIIDNGGEVLIKRVVADDATLANLILLARVSKSQANKVDASTGKQIYIDSETGQETTEKTNSHGIANEKATVNTAVIKYEVANVTDAKTLHDVVVQAETLMVEQDADTIQGAEDPSTWVQYEGTLTDGQECPVKEDVENTDEDGTPNGTYSHIYYDAGTILQDTNSNVFKVTNDNKVQLLGTANSEYVYPIMVIADNGRGVSSKRFNITCSYTHSKGVGFGMYQLNYLGTVDFDAEAVYFSCDPDIVYADKSMSLTMAAKDLNQLTAYMIEDSEEAFLNKVAEFSGIDIDELRLIDVYFGKNRKGESLAQITIDADGYQLNSTQGMLLQGGSNGSFGDAPFGTPDYSKKLIEVFNGTFDDSIFDPNRYMIEACVDANYPLEVKNAISELVTAREDFYFFRDYGFGNDNYDSVVFASTDMEIKNKFIADYFTTYDIIDKFTKKQIPVTIGYSLARILVNHLNNYRNAPFSGLLYDVTIPEAIEGTINYIPKVTPTVDQETSLVDEHINYASYLNGVLTIQTQITSQENETQCSYINNILTVQETMRDIRKLCPRIRGSFIDRTDSLEKYAKQIQDVIDKHRDEYNSITLTWTADDVLINNKIFNAALKVSFKNFVIAEVFTIYTVDSIAASL